MELVLKAAAAALSAAVIGLVIRQKNPELALLLSICTVTLIMIAVVGYASGLQELLETVRTLAGRNETITGPVIKCIGIGIVTKIASALCGDASQRSAAAAIELAGTVCAMSAAMPLVISVLKLIGGMV